MRYLKLFESFEDIRTICKQYNIRNYTINKDGTIDAYNVYLYERKLTKLPLKFNKVNDFDISNNYLTSLEGCPVEVNGDFLCNNNRLVSLEYSPKIIRGEFVCEANNIKTFEYFPSFVRDGFHCVGNPIFQVWRFFRDTEKIELLNDFDIFRDEDTSIIMDRLNDFLLTIGKKEVGNVYGYKNI